MAGYIPPQPPDLSYQVASNAFRAAANCIELILLVQTFQGPATQTQIDAVVNAQTTMSVLVPKPTATIDGITYNWTEYIAQLQDTADKLRKYAISTSGPFMVLSRGRVRGGW
jgi:hypothetical protein